MVLSINKINKFYGARHVVKDVSFDIVSGRPCGLLGRNGHGKTTTMKIVMGIIYANSGEVLLDGIKLDPKQVKLGYLPEERGLYLKISLIDQMVYFGRLRGLTAARARARSLELLERLELADVAKKRAATLSKGNQQKVQLAISLINEPDIIILDEPFTGLDPVNSRLMYNLIEENAKGDKAVLFSSHQMAQIEGLCRDICVINHGEVQLVGELNEIKDGYPKDRLAIRASRSHESEVAAALATIEHKNLAQEQENFVLTLNNEDDRAKIFAAISERRLPVESIEILRPTLLDIFLEKVGEEVE